MKKKIILAIGSMAFVGAGLGLYTLHHGFSTRDNPTAMEVVAATTARRMAVPMQARNLKNPFPATNDALHEARLNWAQNCALCHANNGSGETAMGMNMYPKPPDLRAPRTQQQTGGELYATIQNGIRLTGMPAWGEVRDDDRDRWNLVEFIRHLPKLTLEEEREMERNNPRVVDDSASTTENTGQQEKPGIKPSPVSSTSQPGKTTGKRKP